MTHLKSHIVLSNKEFSLLFLCNTLYHIAIQIFTFILPLIIFELTDSPLAMSSMRAVEVLPSILFGMLIGVIVDRFNRKKYMILTISVMLLMLISILILLYTNQLSLLLLYILGFFLYLCTYSFNNVFHTILPIVLEKKNLTEANSSIALLSTILSIFGPALAGFLLVFLVFEEALLICIVCITIMIIIINGLKIKETHLDKGIKTNIKKDLYEGWYELKSNQLLWSITLLAIFLNFIFSCINGVFVYFSLTTINLSYQELGLIFSFAAIGGIVASLIAKKLKTKFGLGNLLILCFQLASIGSFLIYLQSTFIFTAVGMGLIGFCVTMFNIHYLTLRQETTPNELLGRVAGMSITLLRIASPLGFLVAGILGEFFNVKSIFLFSSILIFFAALYLVRMKKKLNFN